MSESDATDSVVISMATKYALLPDKQYFMIAEKLSKASQSKEKQDLTIRLDIKFPQEFIPLFEFLKALSFDTTKNSFMKEQDILRAAFFDGLSLDVNMLLKAFHLSTVIRSGIDGTGITEG